MNNIITIIFCIFGLTALGQIPTNGLVSHYPFTTNADDQSGNNFNGTVNGATLSPDRFSYVNRSYDFNGTSDHITIQHDPTLKPDFPFTISLWFKIDAFGATSSVLYASDEGTNFYSGFWIGYLPSGTISAGYGDGQGIGGGNRITKVSNTVVDTSSWHNVTAVYNELNDIDLYIDCQLDLGSYTGSATSLVSGTNNSVIGRSLGHSSTAYHNGKIDDIRLYDVAVNPNGVSELCSEDPYVGIKEISTVEIDIYPNPIETYLTINIDKANYENHSISIVDVLGRLVYSKTIISSSTTISSKELGESGIYFLKILSSEDNPIKTKKIILK